MRCPICNNHELTIWERISLIGHRITAKVKCPQCNGEYTSSVKSTFLLYFSILPLTVVPLWLNDKYLHFSSNVVLVIFFIIWITLFPYLLADPVEYKPEERELGKILKGRSRVQIGTMFILAPILGVLLVLLIVISLL